MLELTTIQIEALDSQTPTPVEIVHPGTGEVFVLIRKEVYDLACKIAGGGEGEVWDNSADDDLIANRSPLRKRA